MTATLGKMWAQGRYDLGLSSEEFWSLTPRLFHMLFDRHRAHLVHTEMLHAWTTAAVINTAPFNRSEPASALQYMPNHRDFAANQAAERKANLTDEDEDKIQEWSFKRDQLAAEMRAEVEVGIVGPMLARVRRGEAI